jgi:hypothetical protein
MNPRDALKSLSGRTLHLRASILIAAAAVLAGPASTALAAEAMVDLSRAVVVIPGDLKGPARRAVAMLVEEVAKRTQVTWRVDTSWPNVGAVIGIALAQGSDAAASAEPLARALKEIQRPDGPEGFSIQTDPAGPSVVIAGNDARGVLYGVGRFLRELRMGRGRIELPAKFRIATLPHYRLRGHQLGYRPKTNSYDAWDLDQWERYIRDLAVFGANAIELIPPRSDDDADSPHFPRPPLEMMSGMSKLLDDYGLDVWIWYPAMDADYSKPETVDFALKEWGTVFQALPRIDAVFVPGGDPGHTRPKYLFALLEKETEVLHRYHPQAQMWVSPQSFNQEWLDEFYSLLGAEPKWLSGVVYGPQVRVSLTEVREKVPKRYPIRDYPDITHSRECQYPVPDWDLAFALTEGREGINPRPLGEAAIFRAYEHHTIGFLTYSEGCNDDVNKAVWSALGWHPAADVLDVLRQYSRYFLGERYSESFAQGLMALERNWQGPLLTNGAVETTLQQFQAMERAVSPADLLNWRFQQGLYRAYYDAFVRDRLLYETSLEAQALDALRLCRRSGSRAAMERATALLQKAVTEPVSSDRRARVFDLAEALFQSIRMQLSVPRYKAISVGRGANLDTIDVPLNNRLWLLQRFDELRQLDSEELRLRALEEIVTRTDPGPGGFYDSLGDLTRQPHLVRGPGFARDPSFLRSSLVGFSRVGPWPVAWWRNAQSLDDAPLVMRYRDLDNTAHYAIRVVYTGDTARKVRLEADHFEIHPLLSKPFPIRPLTFDIPPEATADGTLTLKWTRESGLGGNGRGCQVSEVWLIRKAD